MGGFDPSHEYDDYERYEKTTTELTQIIGEVTLNLTDIEAALDDLIVELLVISSWYDFVQRHILGRMRLDGKIQLLKNLVKEDPELFVDGRLALRHLDSVDEANRERNRLIHDLHEVDFEDASITRRRLWQKDATAVDLETYRRLADMTQILAGPGMDALAELLAIRDPLD
jgi:hypothetical protein